MAMALRCSPRWRWRARCMIARTSACSIFRHLSPNARSGLPGARPRHARPTFTPLRRCSRTLAGTASNPDCGLRRGGGRCAAGGLRLAVGQAEGVAEALGVIAYGMAPWTRGHEHVDEVTGRHDAHQMIDLPLAVVGDRLEPLPPGDSRSAALAHLRLAVLGIRRHHLDVEGF